MSATNAAKSRFLTAVASIRYGESETSRTGPSPSATKPSGSLPPMRKVPPGIAHHTALDLPAICGPGRQRNGVGQRRFTRANRSAASTHARVGSADDRMLLAASYRHLLFRKCQRVDLTQSRPCRVARASRRCRASSQTESRRRGRPMPATAGSARSRFRDTGRPRCRPRSGRATNRTAPTCRIVHATRFAPGGPLAPNTA